MATNNETLDALTYQGKLLANADGGYPVLYLDRDTEILCADCATEARAEGESLDTEVFYEGAPVHCAQCGVTIAAAYGDPEGCKYCQEVEGDAGNYAIENADGSPLYADARDGDKVCAEHARFCIKCYQCFAPTQFENHITGGECRTLAASCEHDRHRMLAYVFPAGAEVRFGKGQHGRVLGVTEWGSVEVYTSDGRDADTVASWNVKRLDLRESVTPIRYY